MKTICIFLIAVGFAAPLTADHHAESKATFEEVFGLIKAHLNQTDAAELNSAAVAGLIDQLKPRVQLNPEDTAATDPLKLIAKTNRFNREYEYLRIAAVQEGVGDAVIGAIRSSLSDGPLRGIVLDLRFANGENYGAAANLAGLFADQKPASLKAADQEFLSAAGGDAVRIPVMVLVNKQTTGSAEATAALMRDIKAGLVIGSSTAGMATVYEDFKLTSGDTLRIATQPVKLGSGTELPSSGVAPDIAIDVSLDAERVFLEDPYHVDASGEQRTNGVSSRRVTEADLVRQRREGISLQQVISDRQNGSSAAAKTVSDPSLARALDLLKALSVVENWETN